MAKAKYKVGKDGWFRTKIWDGIYNPDGSKHRTLLSSKKSSGDLERQVNALKNKVSDGLIVQPTEQYFLGYARTWKETYKSVRQNNTKKMYDNVIEKHLIVLSEVKLQDVRRIHCQQVINNAQDHSRTCQQILLTFKQIVKSAIKDKYLPATAYQDICDGIDVPKYAPGEKRALLPEEVAAIRKADFTPRERAFVYLIYGCGLRRGEAIGLNKDLDIDLKRSQLTVRRSVEFDVNKPSDKEPKSHNGHRTIPMPPFLADYLKSYLPAVKGNRVISNMDGKMMTKSGYDKMWGQIKKKMNLAAGGTDKLQVIHGFTAHTFRHDYCTNLCYQIPKISIKRIAQLMGDTEKMVLEVYNHVKDEKENVEEVVKEARAL